MPRLPARTLTKPITPRLRPLADRLTALEGLLAKLVPIPKKWLREAEEQAKRKSPLAGGHMECIPCTEYRHLITAWRHALKWGDGLDRTLSVMLASVTSTKTIGDQLWVKIIGPAACNLHYARRCLSGASTSGPYLPFVDSTVDSRRTEPALKTTVLSPSSTIKL